MTSQQQNNETNSIPIVIFVHGLYSCYLSRTDASSILTSCFTTGFELPTSLLKSFLLGKNGHADIALPITWKHELNDDGERVPVQDTDHIAPSDDFRLSHGKFLDFLETLEKLNLIQLHKIRWDWRRSFEETEKHIASNLHRILSTTQRKATIITHSTGCILSWPTINNHPEWFHSWINVAGAASASNILLHDFVHDWRYSDAKMLKILSKEVMFTCPSLYGFFRVVPHETFRDDNGKTTEFVKISSSTNNNDSTENPVFVSNGDIDLYDVDTWQKYKLGIYGWKNHTVTDEEREHLKNCLSTSKNYRLKHFVRGGKSDDDESFLAHGKEKYDHLNIICYGSDKLDTHNAFGVDLDNYSVDETKTNNYTTGDGTVPSFGWKRIFGGLNRKIIHGEDGATHSSLLNDSKLQNIMMESFFQNEKQRKEIQSTLERFDDNKHKQKKTISSSTIGMVAALVALLAIIMIY